MEERIRLEVLVFLLSVGVFLWAWAAWMNPKPPPVGVFVPAPPAKEVINVPKIDVPTKTIKAYPKLAKAKMGLPPAEQQDDNMYLVSATKLSADLHPRTVVSVLDIKTGEVKQEVRVDPYPWIAAEQTGEVRFDYGVKSDGQRVGRLSLRENLVQIKALHFGVSATLDTDGAAFAGVGVGYKW
jgi:hypothetical protein